MKLLTPDRLDLHGDARRQALADDICALAREHNAEVARIEEHTEAGLCGERERLAFYRILIEQSFAKMKPMWHDAHSSGLMESDALIGALVGGLLAQLDQLDEQLAAMRGDPASARPKYRIVSRRG